VKNPIEAVKGWGMGKLTGIALKAIAEGKLGRPLQWLYWHLKGIKTILGLVLLGAGGAVLWLDSHGVCAVVAAHWAWVECGAWASTIVRWSLGLGAFFAWLGQQDGALHLDAPDLSLDEAIASFRK
jgi:hypothetical protein